MERGNAFFQKLQKKDTEHLANDTDHNQQDELKKHCDDIETRIFSVNQISSSDGWHKQMYYTSFNSIGNSETKKTDSSNFFGSLFSRKKDESKNKKTSSIVNNNRSCSNLKNKPRSKTFRKLKSEPSDIYMSNNTSVLLRNKTVYKEEENVFTKQHNDLFAKYGLTMDMINNCVKWFIKKKFGYNL